MALSLDIGPHNVRKQPIRHEGKGANRTFKDSRSGCSATCQKPGWPAAWHRWRGMGGRSRREHNNNVAPYHEAAY